MTTLALTDEHAKMGKISNNLEKHGEAEANITGFTIPLELQVPRPQLAELMGDVFDRSVWTLNSTGMLVGVDWARRLLPLALVDEVYVGVAAVLGLGGRELEYTDSRVSRIELLAFGNGGITHVKAHLYLRPGIGSENLLLQEYQEHEVAVMLSAGKLRVKADKAQAELPLDAPRQESSDSPAAAVSPAGGKTADAAPESADVEDETPLLDPVLDADHPAMIVNKATLAIGDTAIGTPEEERAKAHARERDIAYELQQRHLNGDPDFDDAGDEDEDSLSTLGQGVSAKAAS